MNFKEARTILGLPDDSTADDAKHAFRNLSKKYHPDVNKNPDAESKFKEINAAYRCLTETKETPGQSFGPAFWDTIYGSHGFGNSGPSRMRAETPINLNTNISFYESVMGVKKELKFNRETKCQSCNGQGESIANNGCDKCNGRGKIVSQMNNMIVVRDCDKCHGQVKKIHCAICSGTGTNESTVSITVTIPPGVQNKNILRLSGMGNFIGNFGPMDQYSDAFLEIMVTPDHDLFVEGKDVVSNIHLSLLEALEGCTKEVYTILGNKSITISPNIKNKDEVRISNLGVARIGDQRIIINIDYPNDTSTLISFLKKDN